MLILFKMLFFLSFAAFLTEGQAVGFEDNHQNLRGKDCPLNASKAEKRIACTFIGQTDLKLQHSDPKVYVDC
jgi:hypothetical protein